MSLPTPPLTSSSASPSPFWTRKKILWTVTAGLILALGIGGALQWRSSRSKNTLLPKKGNLVEAVYGVGTVTSRKIFQVKTSVPSLIRKRPVKEGQAVQAGQLLLVMDEGGRFLAPFEGTITSTPFSEGELTPPQVPLLTLMNLRDLFLEVSLEQQSTLRIRPQQPVVATFESLRQQKFEGKVDAIFPRDGQFIVRIELASLPPQVLPGMTADVSIEVSRKQDVWLVPLAGVQMGQVTLLREGKKMKQKLNVGASDGEWVEVIPSDPPLLLPTDLILLPQSADVLLNPPASP